MISFNYDSDNFIMRSMLALRYRRCLHDVHWSLYAILFHHSASYTSFDLPSPDYVFAVFSHLISQFTIGYV